MIKFVFFYLISFEDLDVQRTKPLKYTTLKFSFRLLYSKPTDRHIKSTLTTATHVCKGGRNSRSWYSKSLHIGWFGVRTPVGDRYFPHSSRPTLRPSQPPVKWVPVLFPGVKRSASGVEHPTLSSVDVRETVDLYLYSPSGSSWPVVGRTSPFYILYCSSDSITW